MIFFFPSEFYVHINENVYICIYLNKKYICNYIRGFWNLLSIIQLHLDTCLIFYPMNFKYKNTLKFT